MRLCTVCSKPLRNHNKTGFHAACKTGEAPRVTSNVRKRFRTVSEALGFDADKLLTQFMEGWLEKVRGSVRLPEGDL